MLLCGSRQFGLSAGSAWSPPSPPRGLVPGRWKAVRDLVRSPMGFFAQGLKTLLLPQLPPEI